jgi:peptidoglycan DL-endopeptidase CwlO
VIRYAYAQLDKPYAWGAAGPGAFNCSGLTMMAWAQAGVSLPHSSRAQFGVGPSRGQK